CRWRPSKGIVALTYHRRCEALVPSGKRYDCSDLLASNTGAVADVLRTDAFRVCRKYRLGPINIGMNRKTHRVPIDWDMSAESKRFTTRACRIPRRYRAADLLQHGNGVVPAACDVQPPSRWTESDSRGAASRVSLWKCRYRNGVRHRESVGVYE